ncbi:deoxyribodipyrimidine photo-lyase [Saccharopolyspora sp. NFXS83]|uniref:cryptochrome/photolyase family protein n=1 Tax=Saccharopolyspora sp. NFXS83 TaxID=2993560 RepID=UPI00224B0490|nr:deoxyribodipyrimidine photo-lyase [Saccharopolyspora sp. NFXS83]MCX2733188.1 deoxyribodipyrimidine photo-lyase [Saccharopolyspora sp. NFXS83]
MSAPAILWFRRDLRVRDHPALAAAGDGGRRVIGVFVLDEALLAPAGPVRRTFLYRCLRELDASLGGRLLVLRGDPAEALAELVAEVGADSVHVSADAGPYGRERDERVRAALGERVEWVATGSPYAVTPGRITKRDGTAYKVFTPFRRAWEEHGRPAPAETDESTADWWLPRKVRAAGIPEDEDLDGTVLPPAGERAALERWDDFRDFSLTGYDGDRDRPDRAGTSRMSPYLRWGCVHPRTLLADLDGGTGDGARSYRNELVFREFYADVLWHWPDSARYNFDSRFDRIRLDTGGDARERFEDWCAGRTGFPIVDAGMRQLLAVGWMHNRVRMVVASFLVKDLHLPWWWGARHFMRHLVDGDLASNQHGWQWSAGSGTDASPYFRIFNPITQGTKFDPDGSYVREHVPELRGLGAKQAHQPWTLPDGPPNGYPPPMVEHGVERQEALARYGEIKNSTPTS